LSALPDPATKSIYEELGGRFAERVRGAV
jgi:hypothetical protein